MRLLDVALKASRGRQTLHHLRSTYSVGVSSATVSAIEHALACGPDGGPGDAFVDRLRRRGLVADEPFRAIPRRSSSELVSIELEPFGSCNLRCRHCFVDFSGAVMTQQTFERVLEGALDADAVELTFNGGEPLLHVRCLDWIERARASGLRTLLFTNATCVGPDVADRLAKAGVARVTVSLDGFQPEHDAVRGHGSFDRAVRGIRELTQRGVCVFTTTLVHPANEARVKELQTFCREVLGVAGCRTSTVAPMGRARQAPDLLLSTRALMAVYSDESAGESESNAPGVSSTSEQLLACGAGVDKLYVSASGRVFGCHLFELSGGTLGHLAESSLSEILARARMSTLLRISKDDLPVCAACPAFSSCAGGCRARARAMTGSQHGPDPVACAKRGLGEIATFSRAKTNGPPQKLAERARSDP
ncbi:MAG: radical SAM protein [Deltaproteobacteria bacterium]|nr:radical SAM protein [Deltaproteobacteria bacterium]